MAIDKKGFTLVELLIVISILVALMIMMVAILNPTALVNRGFDARRKKDVNRIKVAFEEYYNDNKCYPTNDIVENLGLLDDDNCNSGVFAPWLSIWPCDPNKHHYLIFSEPTDCPSWFKVATKLTNLNDEEIPAVIAPSNGGEITNITANYGVSSTNIYWNDAYVDPRCEIHDSPYDDACYTDIGEPGACQSVAVCGPEANPDLRNATGCTGDHCFAGWSGEGCNSACKVAACGQGRLNGIECTPL